MSEEESKKRTSDPDAIFGTWMVIGIAVGVVIGMSMDNLGAGIGIGLALGVGLGAALAARARLDSADDTGDVSDEPD